MLVYAQIKWRCRRGTSELDCLLLSYLNTHYLTASPFEQQLFIDLLNYEDSYLLRYLLDNQAPSDQRILKLVEKIRDGY